MIIPIRRARVKILPFASSVAYPFLIASPDTNVPIALNTQKTGIVTIFIIIGPIIGIAAIKALSPTKTSVKTLITKAINTIIFLSIPYWIEKTKTVDRNIQKNIFL